MDETKIFYFLKVGDRIVSQSSFLQERYNGGDRFPASGFIWICKNTEKTPKNYVVAVLVPKEPRFSITEADQIEATYQTLTSTDYGWKDVGHDRTKSLISKYFTEPQADLVEAPSEELVPEKEAVLT